MGLTETRRVKILVCDHVEMEQLALGAGFDIDYRPGIDREELLRIVGDYEGVVVRSRTKIDKAVLDRASRLKLVARPGTGLDNVDTESATKRGITVVNSPESLVEAVAEHVMMLMLALSRKLTTADQSVKAGKWEKATLMGTELHGKTLGIVGLGRIGRRIGEISRTLGMSILGYDVITIPQDVLDSIDCKMVSLEQLFSASDYVTLHVPMTDQTRHLVDARLLSIMKRSAFIINASRGGVIDESALVDALKRGSIGGAGLDVFEVEPPAGEILRAPNTILTPHVGGQTLEAQISAITVTGEKIRAFFRNG
jgi:D-3-phosphoglycerate dehydrogenase